MWGCEIGVVGYVKQAVGLYLLYLCELRLEMNMRVGGVLTLTKNRAYALNMKRRQIQKNRFAQSKSDLTAKFGTAASDGDVNWRLLNEDLIQHSSMQNWGHYRNTVFQMGEQLRKEGKFSASLEKFLLVCYIDICGPNNISTPLGKKHEYGQKPFTKRSSFLAPGVIKRIEKSATKAKFDVKKLREIFYKLEEDYKQAIPFTQSAEKSWEKLKNEIFS